MEVIALSFLFYKTCSEKYFSYLKQIANLSGSEYFFVVVVLSRFYFYIVLRQKLECLYCYVSNVSDFNL